MSDWPVGLSTGCFYPTSILECLEPIRNSGFGLIEVCCSPKHLDYHDRDAVLEARRRIDHLAIDAYSLHAPFAPDIDITSPNHAQRDHARYEILRAADAAAMLGVRYLVIHPGPEEGGFPAEQRFERMTNAAKTLNDVSRACRRQGLALVLENMLPHLFSGAVRDLMWILGAMDTVDVGICLDTGHAHLAGDLQTIAHKLSGHLWMMHASDNRGEYDDHLPPGDGKVRWEPLLVQLAQVGFRGTIMLEIAGLQDTKTTLDAARRGRNYLRDISRRLRQHRPG